jgi:hypothetical protein
MHVDHTPLLAGEHQVGEAGLVHAALQAREQLVGAMPFSGERPQRPVCVTAAWLTIALTGGVSPFVAGQRCQ